MNLTFQGRKILSITLNYFSSYFFWLRNELLYGESVTAPEIIAACLMCRESLCTHTVKLPCCHSTAHCGCQRSVWSQPPRCLPCTLCTDCPENQAGSLSRTPRCTLKRTSGDSLEKAHIRQYVIFQEWPIHVSTLVWVTGVAAVVFHTQRVSVGQQPASRAVHVAVTGATASKVPHEDVFVGALCQSHGDHRGQHWGQGHGLFLRNGVNLSLRCSMRLTLWQGLTIWFCMCWSFSRHAFTPCGPKRGNMV